ncbi:MAG: response regulator [Bacteroidetes bacterium]|nr:response regulator [Bacteroidota bacterium]
MKLTIKSLLSGLFLSFTIMLIVALSLGLRSLQTVENQANGIIDNEFAKSSLAWEVIKDQKAIIAYEREMMLSTSPEKRRDLKENCIRAFAETDSRMVALMKNEDSAGSAILKEIKVSFYEYQKLINEEYLWSFDNARNVNTGITPAFQEKNQSTQDASHKLGSLLMQFVELKNRNIDVARSRSNESVSSFKTAIISFFVILFLFGVIVLISILWFVYSMVGGEPGIIREMTGKITEGNLSVQFPGETKGIFNSIKILQQTLLLVARKAENIAGGDFSVEIIPQSGNDQLGNSLAKMTRTLSELGKVTEEISQGNFERRLEIKGDNDLVSKSINSMSRNLEKNEKHNREQNWLKDGLNKLGVELSGDKGLDEIASGSISYISRHVEAGRGVIYLLDKEKKQLHLMSSFAFTERDHLSNTYDLGTGVVGQVALEKKAIFLRNVPRDEAPISTGTIQTVPYNTYTYPLVYETELLGVVELASLTPFTPIQTAFLDESNQIIATGIFSAIQRAKIEELLTNSQSAQREAEEKTMQVQEANARLEEQQQQIQQQSEELQQSNSQLEEQQQQLQQQSEELQQTNAQLEEQQQQLMQQTDELRRGNDQLKQAKEDLDIKAGDLEMSNKYKSDFLATMSHELRTPLNSIILLSKMMQKNERGNFSEDDIKRARVVHSAGEELLRLINDILDISKIDAGKTTLTISEFTTESLLNDISHFFASTAKSKGLTLNVDNTFKTIITTDKDKVSQILRNFMSNALKFTRSGTITIKAGESGIKERPVKISVHDTGIGIATEKHKLIFDAFQQVDSSISREYGGTGLGLTISQKLTNLLQGEITLKSEVDKGSEFVLFLPKILIPHEGEDAEYTRSKNWEQADLTETTSPAVRGSGTFVDDRKSIMPGEKIILIVEDDPTFADIVAMVIHNMKMKVLHASTAEQGLRLVQQYKVNGIILDLVLPDMNGVDFMRRLKSFKDLRHIPVQIISGHEKNPELMRLGALDFLQKPVDQEQIQDAIQGILNFSEKNPKDLLIVEDDENHREALTALIRSKDIRITGVDTEEEATKELKKGIYDAVIIDLGLRSGSGMNICKYARENQIKVPIIVYTGKQLSPDEEKELKRYTDRIIIKTVHSENRLLDELTLFLHQTQKERADEPAVAYDLNAKLKRLTGKTILVVDDDIKNVFVLSTALEEHGAKVIDAQNGLAALNMLGEKKGIDLVLMDIMMPVMDGYTAIKKIRENPLLKNMPVIALTAKALKEDREKCISAGADDYLAKPVDYDMLIGLVEAWCQKK